MQNLGAIREMFPGVDDEFLQAVFTANNMNVDATINELLAATSGGPPSRAPSAVAAMEVDAPSAAIPAAAAPPPPPAGVPSLISLSIAAIKAEVDPNPNPYLAHFADLPAPIQALLLPALSYTALQQFLHYTAPDGTRPYTGITQEMVNNALVIQENQFRHLFATKRDDPAIADPHLMLVDVHAAADTFVMRAGDAYENAMFKVFDSSRSPNATLPFVADHPSITQSAEQFQRNFNVFTENALEGLNWNNVLVAGGSVLGALMPAPSTITGALRKHYHGYEDDTVTKAPFRSSDIDIFLYGLPDEDAATAKLVEICNTIKANCPKKLLIVRTAHTVTFTSAFPVRNIQVVLRLYKSPAEVLMGFDLDCVTVGFDGTKVWALPRAVRALNWRYNMVDTTRMSTTYEIRLYKYAARGFAVAVPGLEAARVNPVLLDRNTDANVRDAKGLAKLLALQRARDKRESPSTNTRGVSVAPRHNGLWFRDIKTPSEELRNADRPFNRWNHRGPRVHAVWQRSLLSDPFDRERQVMFEAENQELAVQVKDYDSIFIPWGPRWDAGKVSALFSYRRNSITYADVQQRVFFRTESEIESIVRQSGEYAYRAAARPPHHGRGPAQAIIDDETTVEDELHWLSVDPGRQYIGSFKPEHGDWFAGAVLP